MRQVAIALVTIGVLTGCNRVETSGGLQAAPVAQPLVGDRAAAPEAVVARAEPALAAESAVPRRENWREVTIPAGTTLPVVFDTAVGSATSRVEQPVHGHLARAISVSGVTVLPQGSPVTGVVTDARRSGKVKGLAHVAVRFNSIAPTGDDERYAIRTGSVARTAPATKEQDAVKIGAPAAGGALVGAIVGGKKGAAIGAAAGGGAGTAVVLSTRGKEVSFAKGSVVRVRLAQPVAVRVRL